VSADDDDEPLCFFFTEMNGTNVLH